MRGGRRRGGGGVGGVGDGGGGPGGPATCPEPYVEEEWCWIVIHGAALWALGGAPGGAGGSGLGTAPGISVVNPRSATLRTSDHGHTAGRAGGVRSMQQGGLPRLREWHKKWGRAHGRADAVAACERFREEEVARVARLLGMAPEEAAGLVVEQDEDH